MLSAVIARKEFVKKIFRNPDHIRVQVASKIGLVGAFYDVCDPQVSQYQQKLAFALNSHNPEVVGSNPTPATIRKRQSKCWRFWTKLESFPSKSQAPSAT